MNEDNLVSQLDQMLTQLENNAEMMSVYYKSLTEKGVSEELAQKLVIDFSNALWSSMRKNND